MSVPRFVRSACRWLALLLAVSMLAACAGVKVSPRDSRDYMSLRRGDVLSTGHLSTPTVAALQVVGLEAEACDTAGEDCRAALGRPDGLSEEQRLSALAELWLQAALDLERVQPQDGVAIAAAYLEAARHAYAYLFFSRRGPGERALEDRQTQVRDYYNFAVQQLVSGLFERYHDSPQARPEGSEGVQLELAGWRVHGHMSEVRLARGRSVPDALLPAASLSFSGMRNQYRRDGLGAELVAVTDKRVVKGGSEELPWSETPFPAVSMVAAFPGETLAAVLATREAHITGYDPYRRDSVRLAGVDVPLAADFTSGYGLWLARSGFASQALLTLVGQGEVLQQPHVYLLQPYDPQRRIVVMLHGLASSPEAWINVANEVMGDESLRRNYQIWQVYYPTNAPLAVNNQAIREALAATLAHFDPAGTAPASQGMVLVGHSMGGVLSRLMVSSSGERLWEAVQEKYALEGRRRERAEKMLAPYLRFEPLPGVGRAVFIAAPHRGTPFAENTLSRWAASLVRLPVSLLGRLTEVTALLVAPGSASAAPVLRPLNSIDNLSDQDPFVRLAAGLPISPAVPYHSIIGNDTPELALRDSSDGVVPYASAHLEGAASEKVVASWHSVQETPEAILELRRILHAHLAGMGAGAAGMMAAAAGD